MGFQRGAIFKVFAEALERGEWWAIIFVVVGTAFLLLILFCPLLFMKFK